MNRADPPHVATWMLEHLTVGSRNEALAGDLLEEIHSGRRDRTRGWYWRQVFAAIAAGFFREILNHRSVLFFAVLWSMVSPSWVVLSTNVEVHSRAFGLMWQMDWPWSSICAIALSFSTSLLFIWSGMTLYLVPRMSATRGFNVRSFVHSMLQALPMFIAIAAVPYAMSLIFHSGHGQGIDRRMLTPLNALIDLRTWAVVERLFNLPILFYGLRRATRLLSSERAGMPR